MDKLGVDKRHEKNLCTWNMDHDVSERSKLGVIRWAQNILQKAQ